MDKDYLTEKIQEKAEREVQRKINTLRGEIFRAIGAFCGIQPGSVPFRGRAREVIDQLAKTENCNVGWPSWLWEDERQRVSDDIFSKMDSLQQLLMSGPILKVTDRPQIETPRTAEAVLIEEF